MGSPINAENTNNSCNTDKRLKIQDSPSHLGPTPAGRSWWQTDCEPESKWRTHPLQRRTKLGKKNSPKPLNGTASLGAWGEIIRRRLLFFIFCEQPLDKLSQLGFVLGQGGRLVDFVGGQNKGTSGDKEENEDKFVHQYRSYSETDSKFKAIFSFFPTWSRCCQPESWPGVGQDQGWARCPRLRETS